jgi:DnaJ-class molecular chaperone
MKAPDEMTYYQLLGVGPDASVAEIRDAYHQIARVYHPDSNFFDEIIDDQPSQEASVLFRRITAAYNTLIDAEKRSAYDALFPAKLPGWDEVKEQLFPGVRTTSSRVGVQEAGMAGARPAFGVGLRPAIMEESEEMDHKSKPNVDVSVCRTWPKYSIFIGGLVAGVILYVLTKHLIFR